MKSRYRTRCKACGHTIDVGDEITKRDGIWVHEACPKRSSEVRESLRGRNTPVMDASISAAIAQVAEAIGNTGDLSVHAFEPSVYQKAIFEFGQHGEGNGVAEAVAGSGKTTTLVKMLELLPENMNTIFLAYNRHIAKQLRNRVPSHVQVSTIHALGFKQCRKLEDLDKRNPIEEDKTGLIMDAFWPVHRDVEKALRIANRGKRSIMRRIVSLAKNTLFDYNDVQTVLDTAEHYGIELNGEGADILAYLPKVMQESMDNETVIDYDDMIWFPVVKSRLINHMDKFEFILVDEAQDLNACQIKFLLNAVAHGGRILAVGDRHQSLYGFRGADVRAIPRLIEMMSATTLPLSISYRCPRSHVLMAKEIVPEIEPSDTAKEGTIREIDINQLVPQLNIGDMVICRTNAPLVAPAFAVIRAGKKAIIRGKDIGKNIVAFIERFDTDDITELEVMMQEYTQKEYQRLLDKGKELQAEEVMDRMETVIEVARECRSVRELITKLIMLFDDENEGVVFSSVHRAKGLEADNVFILRPDLLPHPKAKQDWELEQEQNTLYVALTRSKDTLTFVNGQQ